jgi:glycosyltransferase involved in cell wall biosynthesis
LIYSSLISVIVPNYNHKKFLKKRLDSIFNQSFQDFEVILLDDKSTDDSIQVLSKYATHSKVSHYINNEQNSGSPFKQWSKGISLAKGKYIWIAESDDYSDPLFLEKTVAILEKNPSIGLVSVYSQMVDETGRKLQNSRDWLPSQITKDAEKVYIEDGTSFLLKEMLYKNSIHNASGVLFRKSLASDLELDFTKFKQAGDVAFWVELLKQSDIAILKETLNYWRKHSKSVTKQNYKTRSLVMSEHLKIIKYVLKKINPKELEQYLSNRSHTFNRLIRRWYRLNAYSFHPWRKQDLQFVLAGQALDKKFIYRCLRIVFLFKKNLFLSKFREIYSSIKRLY